MPTKRPEYITQTEAVDLIVGRVDKPSHEKETAWRNKINTRIAREIKKCKIAKISEKLVFQDFLRYCQEKYGVELFLDYGVDGNATGSFAPITMEAPTGFAFSIPSTLEGCHSLIADLYSEIYRKNQEIDGLKKEIKALRPDAERYREICEINKGNGSIRHEK